MENEKGHQILQQIPLIRAPISIPPKLPALPSDYTQLPNNVPETRVQKRDLESWIQECETVKVGLETYGKKDIDNYNEWHDKVVKKMAPGYIGGSTLLTPTRRSADTPVDSLSSLTLN